MKILVLFFLLNFFNLNCMEHDFGTPINLEHYPCTLEEESVASPKESEIIMPPDYLNLDQHYHLQSGYSHVGLCSKNFGQKQIAEKEEEILNIIDKITDFKQLRNYIKDERKLYNDLIKKMESQIINFLSVKESQKGNTNTSLFFAILIGATDWVKKHDQEIKDQITQKIEAVGKTPMALALQLEEEEIADILFDYIK
ncbi:hypothetical protein M1446_02970 [Candidatus Dependentiae bacterium]|nr:hypothetical protein [Candidatus Dependentiae bacterium]